MASACAGSDASTTETGEDVDPASTSVASDVETDDTSSDDASSNDASSNDGDGPVAADEADTAAEDTAADGSDSDDLDGDDPNADDAESEPRSLGSFEGRGLRAIVEDDGTDAADASDTDTSAEPAPTTTPEVEPVSVEPTPAPTPTPTPTPEPDPIAPQAPPPAIAQDVPSDDLVVPGPATDDGAEIDVISDGGILACATTEAAIEFLDRGDLTRVEEALQSAGALASGASEAGISALATQLSSAGRDGDAAFEVIVSMLSACAQYGYEV